MENCSAHANDDDVFPLIFSQRLPPSTTAALQPVDLGIGRSSKAAYRRLLVNHFLYYLEEAMKRKEVFKLTKAVTIYDGVRLMAEAWDLVPRSVVINGWLKRSILATNQQIDLLDFKSKIGRTVECAMKPQIGTIFDSEVLKSATRAEEAKINGQEFIDGLRYAEMDFGNKIPEDEPFTVEVVQDIRAGIQKLPELGAIEDIDAEMLDNFMDEEDRLQVCQEL